MRFKMMVVLEYDAKNWPEAGITGNRLLDLSRATMAFIDGGKLANSVIQRLDGDSGEHKNLTRD